MSILDRGGNAVALPSALSNSQAMIEFGSNEIRTAADDLAKRTEQQPASVEETAAALEEITTTVKDSSRRAEEAGRLVARARDHAERSGQVVRDAIGAMDQIETSSGEISNMGFAVVAQEVGELAQRSAKAAKEIKSLITASGSHVANGVGLVTNAGSSLREIAGQVHEINANVAAIVEAAHEQSTALGGINQAINTVDQGTQQNAAMVEEQTAASHGPAREAAALFELLEQFRFDDTRRSRPSSTQADRHLVPPTALKVVRSASARSGQRGSTAVALKFDWEE